MWANNDIARISSFLESSKSEREWLSSSTWSIYDTSKRINLFLSGKNISEIQKIKENLYHILEDPFLPEENLEKYMEILNYL